MLFNFESPSISSIRAKFLIEKLNELSSGFSPISLCATGRTGSGKTTLGNRLIGTDYFMPSTGEQDCTDEVNLVEFPNGLKYFDLPGVASKGKLENYNRAALDIEQHGKFENVDNLTLSQYQVEAEPRKNHFTVSEFRERQILEPDLILYMIAPDKQFLDVDCHYLGDLLSRYSQVIYVFNMFADKQTGTIYATEQNITDVTTRIKEVHNIVFGESNQPIIVPVNCWTGEGISELVSRSCELLGSEKGQLFNELIDYQESKTPNKYIDRLKHSFINVLAYVSCQKPEGSYKCDQPIHKTCYQLLEFLVNLKLQSEQIPDVSDNSIKRLIDEALSLELEETSKNYNISLKEKISFIQKSFDLIEHRIYELTARKVSVICDLKDERQKISILENKVNSKIEEYHSIEKQIPSIHEEIENLKNECKSLINESTSLEPQIQSHQNKCNALKNDLVSFEQQNDLNRRRNQLRNRRKQLENRKNGLDSGVSEMKNNPYLINDTLLNAVYSTSLYIEEEENSLQQETRHLDQLGSERKKKESKLKNAQKSRDQVIKQRDQIKRKITSKQKNIEKKSNQIKANSELQKSVQEEIQITQEKTKVYRETIEFYKEILNYLNQEFKTIEAKIEYLNSRFTNFKTEYASLLELENVSEQQIASLREKLNDCLEEMHSLNEEIAGVQRDILICSYKLNINKLIANVLVECTTHHFDNTVEFEYQGSTYNCLNEKGLNMVLCIIYLVLDVEVILSSVKQRDKLFNSITFGLYNGLKSIIPGKKPSSSKSSLLSTNISTLLSELGDFPKNSDTTQVASWLEPKIGNLFTASFDEMLRRKLKAM
jgi:hypothetical protein